MINEMTNTVVKKVRKGVWRMPRLTEAMKDVISCDKLRVGAHNQRSEDFRMRKLTWVNPMYRIVNT